MNTPTPHFPAFSDWLTRHRALVARLADQHRVELDDARQEAWLAWDEAARTWSPAGSTAQATWVARKLKNRLRRLAEQARFGVELDADDAPQLAADDEKEIAAWRVQEADAAGEARADALRGGTSGIAARLGVTQRRARQIVAELVEQAQAGTPQLDLTF